MIAGFKKFIIQGNVVDLAVGVVIGTAFGALIGQFTKSFIEPLIKALTGGGDTGGTFTINGQIVDYGAFVNALITFVLTAAVVYFVIVVPMNAMKERRARDQGSEPVEPTHEERVVELLERIAGK